MAKQKKPRTTRRQRKQEKNNNIANTVLQHLIQIDPNFERKLDSLAKEELCKDSCSTTTSDNKRKHHILALAGILLQISYAPKQPCKICKDCEFRIPPTFVLTKHIKDNTIKTEIREETPSWGDNLEKEDEFLNELRRHICQCKTIDIRVQEKFWYGALKSRDFLWSQDRKSEIRLTITQSREEKSTPAEDAPIETREESHAPTTEPEEEKYSYINARVNRDIPEICAICFNMDFECECEDQK